MCVGEEREGRAPRRHMQSVEVHRCGRAEQVGGAECTSLMVGMAASLPQVPSGKGQLSVLCHHVWLPPHLLSLPLCLSLLSSIRLDLPFCMFSSLTVLSGSTSVSREPFPCPSASTCLCFFSLSSHPCYFPNPNSCTHTHPKSKKYLSSASLCLCLSPSYLFLRLWDSPVFASRDVRTICCFACLPIQCAKARCCRGISRFCLLISRRN